MQPHEGEPRHAPTPWHINCKTGQFTRICDAQGNTACTVHHSTINGEPAPGHALTAERIVNSVNALQSVPDSAFTVLPAEVVYSLLDMKLLWMSQGPNIVEQSAQLLKGLGYTVEPPTTP